MFTDKCDELGLFDFPAFLSIPDNVIWFVHSRNNSSIRCLSRSKSSARSRVRVCMILSAIRLDS